MGDPAYNKCPHCGYIPPVCAMFYAEGDLLSCNKCKGRIDVERRDGKLVFVKSTDTTYGID